MHKPPLTSDPSASSSSMLSSHLPLSGAGRARALTNPNPDSSAAHVVDLTHDEHPAPSETAEPAPSLSRSSSAPSRRPLAQSSSHAESSTAAAAASNLTPARKLKRRRDGLIAGGIEDLMSEGSSSQAGSSASPPPPPPNLLTPRAPSGSLSTPRSSHSHARTTPRTLSSSTASAVTLQTQNTTAVTAPPGSAHVPGLGDDPFADLVGLPAAPPSGPNSTPAVGRREVVAYAPRERLAMRWAPVVAEEAAEDRSRTPLPLGATAAPSPPVDELDERQLRAMQALAEGTPPGLGIDDTPRALRGSHSMDSVLTARGVPAPTPAPSPSLLNSYPTLVFDVLQTYDGRRPGSARAPPAPYEQGELVTPTPPDDPRFILWSHPPSTSAATSRPPTLRACTPERLIAQLTSSLDYDLLLDTLLAYRPFLAPPALARLLIARFMWSLQPALDARQEVVRKIVRLRTWLTMRCWLLVFFRVDFVRDKEVRDVLVGWLNTMERDEEVRQRDDVLKLIRRLKRVVRDCRETYSRDVRSEMDLSELSAGPSPSVPTPPEDPPSDIDLSDLSPRVSADYDRLAGRTAAEEYAHLATYGKPNPVPKRSSLLMSGQPVPPPEGVPLVRPVALDPGERVGSTSPPPALHTSALGRAVLKTMGGLGKLKRAVTRTGAYSCDTAHVFDLDLAVPSGAAGAAQSKEEYLNMLVEEQAGNSPPPPPHRELEQPVVVHAVAPEPDPEAEPRTSSDLTPALSPASPTSSEPSKPQRSSMTSLSSSSGAGYSRPQVIPLDEYMSDSDLDSSDGEEAAGGRPKRLPRRLPMRRELEFNRRSTDTVSSLGMKSYTVRDSVVSGYGPDLMQQAQAPTQAAAQAEGEQQPSKNPLLMGPMAEWQLALINKFLDSDEEQASGDAEAALAKLEGQIDGTVKDRKRRRDDEFEAELGRYAEALRERMARGAMEEREMSPGPEDGEVDGEGEEAPVAEDEPSDEGSFVVLTARDAEPSPVAPSQPFEPPASRPSAPTPTLGRPLNFGAPSPSLALNHQSFILEHRSDAIAEALCAVDFDMSLGIKVEEIVLLEWYRRLQEEPDVLEWATYVKKRALVRYAVQQGKRKDGEKLSDIAAVKVRFNLMVHFVAHEILLTHPGQRVALVNKWIRVACKLYRMNSYATVVPIIAGLLSPEVTIAMRRLWNRVGLWEMKMFHALKAFTSPDDDFKNIREAVTYLLEGGNNKPAAHPGSGSGKNKGTLLTCVPFIGVYVSQMHRVARMPDYIDPTDPAAPVRYDAELGEFAPLRNPDKFASLTPLPPSVPLEPLMNVEKARNIADIVKNFVAGQHLAVNMKFTDVDRALWQKCLRIRRLDSKELHLRLMAE